jgi:hypothetical protein
MSSDSKQLGIESYAALTEEQQQMLEAMKKRYGQLPQWHENNPTPAEGEITAPGVFNEDDLKRFLRARKWNLKAAVQQFDDRIAWRKKLSVDHCLDDPHEVASMFKKICPSNWALNDKFGRPCLIQTPGRCHFSVIQKFISIETAISCHIVTQETLRKRCREQSVECKRYIAKFLGIVDLTGVELSMSDVFHILKAMTQVDERYYPETLGNMVVVNAPTIFSVLWSMVKKFIDPETATKIIICKQSNTEETLRRFFDDLSQLPIEIISCGREGLFSNTTLEETNAWFEEREAKLTQQTSISRNKTFPVEVKVNATDTPQVVEWWFRSNDDMRYSVSYTKDGADGKAKNVRAPVAVDSHKCPVEGNVYISAGQTGTITLQLINNSMFTSRSVTYYLRFRDAKSYEIAARAKPVAATTTAPGSS